MVQTRGCPIANINEEFLVMGRVVISRVSSGSGISFFQISRYRAGRVFDYFSPGGSGISLLIFISGWVLGNFHHLLAS